MKSKYPDMLVKNKGITTVAFEGDVMLKPELQIYKIRIEYSGNLSPHVKIIEPKLVANPPHYYKSTERLCLYHSEDFKWNANKLVAKEVISWTIAWIYFYECWLQTGEWYGPESHHHSENAPKKDTND